MCTKKKWFKLTQVNFSNPWSGSWNKDYPIERKIEILKDKFKKIVKLKKKHKKITIKKIRTKININFFLTKQGVKLKFHQHIDPVL
jgi:hypothetical protein